MRKREITEHEKQQARFRERVEEWVKTVDVKTLPMCTRADRRNLPTCSAVYFVLEADEVVYVGQAGHLRGRRTPKTVHGSVNSFTAWIDTDEFGRLERGVIEAAFIRRFLPRYNKVGIPRNAPIKQFTDNVGMPNCGEPLIAWA